MPLIDVLKDRDYFQDLEIGDDLQDEWIKHPSLYMYYSESHADAIDTRDKAKQFMEVEAAKLDSYLRKEWAKLFPEDKMTEAGIKAKVLQHVSYKKAQNLLNKANHNVNILSSAKSAFEHRKKALENIVTLTVMGFHSEPKKPKTVQQKEVRQAQKKHLGKRILKKS